MTLPGTTTTLARQPSPDDDQPTEVIPTYSFIERAERAGWRLVWHFDEASGRHEMRLLRA